MATKRKITPYEWRAHTVAGMQERKAHLEAEVDAIVDQIKNLNALIKPLLAAKLTKPEPVEEDEVKPEPNPKKKNLGRKKGKPGIAANDKHWTKNPSAGYKERRDWKKRVETWRKKMNANLKKAHKARAKKGKG